MPSCYQAVCCLSEQSLSIARSSGHKGGVEEPMGLLYDMNDCYSKLKELVPGIPQGTKLSQVEILQHVIDYIFDLQIVLGEEQEHNNLLALQVRYYSASLDFYYHVMLPVIYNLYSYLTHLV